MKLLLEQAALHDLVTLSQSDRLPLIDFDLRQMVRTMTIYSHARAA